MLISEMSAIPAPTPKPRASAPPPPPPSHHPQSESKKPVPLPRIKSTPIQEQPQQQTNESFDHPQSQVINNNINNTFGRRLRSTSKQISDEISGKVNETKRAMIETTRLSVRRIARRFSSSSTEQNESPVDVTIYNNNNDCSSDIFNTIRFQSPLTIEPDLESEDLRNDHSPVYMNFNGNADTDSDDSISLPPPIHPPPPLPDESMYDQPQSSSRPTITPRTKYEAVFPINIQISSTTTSSESENDSKPKPNLERSGSWSFYDPVTLNEVIYANTESVGNLPATILRADSNNRSSGESSAYSELNSCYENYILELKKNEAKELGKPTVPARVKNATKSMIFEFDPLFNSNSNSNSAQTNDNKNSDIAILEQLLDRDLYWNMPGIELNFDEWSMSSEMESDEFLNPPTPPKRFDSLTEEPKSPTVPEEKTRTSWFISDKSASVSGETKKYSGWRKQLNDVLKKVPESARNIRKEILQKDKYLDRPTLNCNNKVIGNHKGILFKISRKSVEDLFGEFLFRWCILGNGALTFYSDNGCDNVKESYTLDSILSVQLMEKKLKFETEMHCFEVSVCGKFGRSGHTFGCSSLTECKRWMQKIAEALTNRFPINVMSDYKKMGWTYLKENVTGNWAGAWLILSSRNLFYAKDDVPMNTIDLRKARCIQLQESDPETPKTTDKGPNLLVDTQEQTLYFRMWTSRETKFWFLSVRSEAFCNGRRLDEQQLTKGNVPVIIEKCINFVYAHGSMSEGIYRRSGSSTKVSEILNQFHKNAWAVTLTLDNCSEHDVATVLKRFIRDLPELLISSESSKYLFQIANSFQNTNEKVPLYKAILEQFPIVTYNTLRRLLGHLSFIQSQASKNRMSVENLAAIWGPTLVHHQTSENEWTVTETNLVVQLISLYRLLYPVSSEELDKERLMLQVLERCNRGAQTGQGPAHVKASGDLRVWVHLCDKNGEAVNITIGPQKLAADICVELSEKMKTAAYELQLEEWVLNDHLRRPIHYSEKVLDVVLRWGYWDEADRKDNCLVLTHMTKYKQFDKIPEGTMILSDEFKFADNKSRTFKFLTFKFDQMKLCCFKDKIGNVKLQEWNIEDIFWYFGYEQNRNPQTKWSITFILRTQAPCRSRGIPYFGYTIGGNDVTVRTNWLSAMIRAEHPTGLQPPILNNVD